MMNIQKVGAPIRFFLFFISAVLWAGIWHTGFAVASWILYIPAIFLLLAAITGICPGMMFSNMLFKDKPSSND
jgi:hypothetical protein